MHEEDENHQVDQKCMPYLVFFYRKVLNPDGQSTRVEDKVLAVNVKPGWKSGTKITFPKEGDQHPGRVPADIVFVITVDHFVDNFMLR